MAVVNRDVVDLTLEGCNDEDSMISLAGLSNLTTLQLTDCYIDRLEIKDCPVFKTVKIHNLYKDFRVTLDYPDGSLGKSMYH